MPFALTHANAGQQQQQQQFAGACPHQGPPGNLPWWVQPARVLLLALLV
jgi:hypothetical protein